MNRRSFLRQAIMLLGGSFGGLVPFAGARARNGYFYQPRIAIIIDDIGYSAQRARQFYRFGIPITFSILPRLSCSSALAVEIHELGQEIMLHQPMEPFNSSFDPGPGALYTGFRQTQIMRIMRENIADVPFITGVNNHMGSRFTASPKEIDHTMRIIRHLGLFFIDSMTTIRSKAYQTARSLNMATARRDVFLDNQINANRVLEQLFHLKKCALKYGHAVGIGHPFPETARAIREFIACADHRDVVFVPVSKIIYT